MDGKPFVVDGELVALRLAVFMEETPQILAVRAACSSGKQDRAFPEEFGGRLLIEQACTVADGSAALLRNTRTIRSLHRRPPRRARFWPGIP